MERRQQDIHVPILTQQQGPTEDASDSDNDDIAFVRPSASGWLEPPPLKRTYSVTRLLGLGAGSTSACIYNLFSSVLGAGVLGLPYAAKRYGFVGGILLIVPFAITSLYTLRLLQWAAALSCTNNYRELCAFTVGQRYPFTLHLISVIIFFNTFGSLVVYLIVLGDLISGFASMVGGTPGGGSLLDIIAQPALVIIVLGVGVAMPLSLVKNLSSLRYTSFLSLASIVYLAVMLTVRTIQQVFSDRGASVEAALAMPPREIPALLGGLPTFIYAFSCHFNYFAAVDGLKKKTQRKMLTVQTGSIVLSLLVYVAIVATVLLLFAERTESDFLVNLPRADNAFNVAKVTYTMVLIAAYPLNCHPCVRALLDEMGEAGKKEATRNVATVCVVATSIILAIYCPNISVALGLVGGTATSSVIYIFPALFFLNLSRVGSPAASPMRSDGRPKTEKEMSLVHRVPFHRFFCFMLLGLGAFAWTCSVIGLFSG